MMILVLLFSTGVFNNSIAVEPNVVFSEGSFFIINQNSFNQTYLITSSEGVFASASNITINPLERAEVEVTALKSGKITVSLISGIVLQSVEVEVKKGSDLLTGNVVKLESNPLPVLALFALIGMFFVIKNGRAKN